jgi:hypothetical protein
MLPVSAGVVILASAMCQSAHPSTYDEFMHLRPEARHEVFASLSADQKSQFKREHVTRWLTAHRRTLTAAQVKVVNEAIEFLSAEYYSQPNTPENRKREEVLRRQLECSLGRVKVAEAMTFRADLAGQSWTDWTDEWRSWFQECLRPE